MAKANSRRNDQPIDDDRKPIRSGPPSLPSRQGRGAKPKSTRIRKSGNSHQWLWICCAVGVLCLMVAIIVVMVGRGGRERLATSETPATSDLERPLSPGSEPLTEEMAGAREPLEEVGDASSNPDDTVAQSDKDSNKSAKSPSEELQSETLDAVATSAEVNSPESIETVPNEMAVDETTGNESEAAASVDDAKFNEIKLVIDEASRLMQQKKYKLAIAMLNRASFKFKTETRPDFYLGLIYSGVGANEPQNAEKYFKRVLEREPQHVATLNNLGLVQIKNKKFRAAWTCFSNSMKEGNSVAPQNLGRLLNQSQILGMKKEEVKLVKELNPELQNYNERKGWRYLPFDDTAASQAEYKEFCRDGDLEDRSCSHCLGHGAVRCRACGGKRNVLITGTIDNTFHTDGDSRPITTSRPTSALVSCRNCGGSGRQNCPHCDHGIDRNLDAGRYRAR